jgi:sulfite reductase (NADPH) hemoprotein beta-component
MYQYSSFDKAFISRRVEQYRDQLTRWLKGQLADEEFRPLRLQNGWYIQRYAPMIRVAIPYGELASIQLKTLAKIAREYDQPDSDLLQKAQQTQNQLDINQGFPLAERLRYGYGHFTTRQNIQYNWIPIEKSADVMELLAKVCMHGIQTSGNCIRNITSDELAGIAVDEDIDPRPYCELLRQWSTLHPEFAYLPRKFKIAVIGATEDRAASYWHDVGLQLHKNDTGEVGFRVLAGGGMGRTPVIASIMREFLPWHQILNYLEALVRVYNQFGRRDNIYKARIKILIRAEGQKFIDALETEYQAIVEQDGAPHTISQDTLDRMYSYFQQPPSIDFGKPPKPYSTTEFQESAYQRWLKQNVVLHKNPDLRAVKLSLKRHNLAPGDATPEQMEAAAYLAETYSSGEIRVTHDQNLLLPWVREKDLKALWQDTQNIGLATPNIKLFTDMIACPGGDFCALANARSLPLAASIMQRYQDIDELEDLGEIDLHISGCINSCGHHHSGHIGILGVDKDGKEWYQLLLGGSDGSELSGEANPGKIIGPAFTPVELLDAIDIVLDTYVEIRQPGESFIHTVKRVGIEPFKTATNIVRQSKKEKAIT